MQLWRCDGKLINHLLFMDDLKLYGKSDWELESWVEVASGYSKNIGMEFRLDKCAVLSMKVHREGIEFPSRGAMWEVDENGYKYLGMSEGRTGR